MIAYDLQCSSGHTFEGWFEDGKAYYDQKKRGLVTCPVCNDTSVSRVPSTFAIKASQRPANFPAKQPELDKIGSKIVDFVQKNFDDVGCDFAKEALKIHYGAVEPRNIRGISTKEEEKTLEEEGIEFFKIPMPTTPDTDA
ncbi:MAG: DUF1178 family protein [Thermodesulfobacteriota bacterium]|nr:DUF1178 family protein [Thermodesulfobacteriota bacterium]